MSGYANMGGDADASNSGSATANGSAAGGDLQLTMPDWNIRKRFKPFRIERSFANTLKVPEDLQSSVTTTEQKDNANPIAAVSGEWLKLKLDLPFDAQTGTDGAKAAVNSTGWLGVDGSCDLINNACTLTFFLKQTELPTWSRPGLEISWMHQLSWVTAFQANQPVAHQAQVTLMNMDFKKDDKDKEHVEWAFGQVGTDTQFSSLSLGSQLEFHQGDVNSFILSGGVNLKKDAVSGRWSFDSAMVTFTFAPAHWIIP